MAKQSIALDQAEGSEPEPYKCSNQSLAHIKCFCCPLGENYELLQTDDLRKGRMCWECELGVQADSIGPSTSVASAAASSSASHIWPRSSPENSFPQSPVQLQGGGWVLVSETWNPRWRPECVWWGPPAGEEWLAGLPSDLAQLPRGRELGRASDMTVSRAPSATGRSQDAEI